MTSAAVEQAWPILRNIAMKQSASAKQPPAQKTATANE
jgi:hypothetical protein